MAADLDSHVSLALLVQREIDWRASRGLNRPLMTELATAKAAACS